MEAVNGVSEGDKGGPPPPSPLTGCYLLIVIGEPHCSEHKDIILQRIAKGLLSWDVNDCLVDLEKELAIITEQALEGEEARYGERLIQFASENLVTEILIHPVVSTLAQCVRNLLSSFTRHRHIIHAGYTFANNGSWVLQDGTFSLADFSEAFQEIEVLRVIRAYENGISLDIHCAPEGDWTRLPKDPFTKGCKVRVNPNDVLTAGSPSISSFINYLEPFLIPAQLENILESSDVVGNIRFSRPTLYVFPGGQGDAALFGINGFNMLLDGGFSRKACFWDFVRHLDRLDAVLLTRLNNSNVSGISAVLRRKKQNAVYPQIGHFFCNIQERKAILSPDGDKDKDPLLINLMDEGQEIVSNLRHLSLIPQVCYRDSEPINLYHKVGHGTLDMYVLSPAKDSKEVREFLQKWNNNDQKLFANPKTNKEFVFPLQNLVSICALLVWQPANPEDTITRILFPGSSPQNKIFEGLDKIKSLEFIKHPVCSEKSLAPTSILRSKQSMLERIIPTEKPERKITVDNKKERPQKPLNDNILDTETKNAEVNGLQQQKEPLVKKSDSTESEKSITKQKKIIENGEQKDKPKPKPKTDTKPKPRSESQQRKVKNAEKKPSPTTPKKQVNGESKPKPKASPTATPAKSAKEANNRKVVESKIKAAPKKEPPKPPIEKKEIKTERKPISRRPKDISKVAGSPSKKVNGVQKPDSISRRGKLDKEGTTDSSTVSTPSADQDSILKKDISKLTTDELQKLKAQELADLKEEQEAVKEIEAVFRKSEHQEDKPSDFRKIKDLSIDDKLESEEYLIIEKTEIEQDVAVESNKEEETQKIARDSEESEKQRKLSDNEEKQTEIKEEVQKIITSATDIVKGKEEVTETPKEVSVVSPEDKVDVSTDKRDENKEVAQESQPDEKGSANIESGATTTAPTLPEDERMPLDEIKEDNGDQIIEEKHVKEDTKEKDVPVIQLPPKTFDNVAKLPPVVGIRLDKQSHIRDIVKTPDEVADLPVHEEVEFDHYDEFHTTEAKQDVEEIKEKKEVKLDSEKKPEAVEKEKTDVVHKEEKKEEEKIVESKDEKLVEKEAKAVISEDLNKKELSKSPDEEKDTDEHELEQKMEETKDKQETVKVDTEVELNKIQPDVLEKETEKLEEIKEREKVSTDIKKVEENEMVQLDKRKPEEVIEKSEKEVKEKDAKEEKARDEVPKEKITPLGIHEQIKLKEDMTTIHKIDEKLEKMKDEVVETVDTTKKVEDVIIQPGTEYVELVKQDVKTIEKIDEKLQKLKEEVEEKHVEAISEVITHKVEEPQHAESVVITTDSLPESPMTDEKPFEDKIALGEKSPKEREEDVAKIVASVAEVLKSDAPLEEFEGKIPFTIPYKSYTTELRETHITTVESPVSDENKTIKTEEKMSPKTSSTYFIEEERKIAPIDEEQEIQETRVSKMIKDSNELMQATSKIIHDIKAQPKNEEVKEDQDAEAVTVHRMLVTASSEDGGEETEICPPGTITFSRSSESSGRSSPDIQSQKQSQKSSIGDTFSEATVLTKTVKESQEKAKLPEDKADSDKKETKEKKIDEEDTTAVLDTEENKEKDTDDKVSTAILDKEETKEKKVDEDSTAILDKVENKENKIDEKDSAAILNKEETKEKETDEKDSVAILDKEETKEMKIDEKDSTAILDKAENKEKKIDEKDNTTILNKGETKEKKIDEKDSTAILNKEETKEKQIDEKNGAAILSKEEKKEKKIDGVYNAAMLDKEETKEEKIDEKVKEVVEKAIEKEATGVTETAKVDVKDEAKKEDVPPLLSQEAKSLIDSIEKIEESVEKPKDTLPKDEKDDTKSVEDIIVKETANEKATLLESQPDKEMEKAETTKIVKEEIKDVAESMVEEAAKTLETAAQQIQTFKEDVETKVEAITKEQDEKKSFMGGIISDIGKSLVNDATQIIDDIHKKIDDARDDTKSKVEDLKEELTTKKEAIEQVIQDVKEAITKEEVKEETKDLEDNIIQRKKELLEAAKDFEDTIIKETEQLMENTKSEIKEAKEVVESKVQNVKETLAEQKATAVGVVEDIEAAIAKDVKAKVVEAEKKIEDAKIEIKDVCKETAEKVHEKAAVLEEGVKKVTNQTEELLNNGKKVLEECKDKIEEKASSQVKEVEQKSETLMSGLKTKENEITETIAETKKQVENEFAEKKETVMEALEQLNNDISKAGIEIENVVKAAAEAPFIKKDAKESETANIKDKQEGEKRYDLYNGLESVEKMVVDVLTADREDDKKGESVAHKIETEVESIVEKGVAEVKELVEETKEAVTSIFKHESEEKEEVLEKAADDIEKNYEIVSDMAKSMIFEKCDKTPEEEHQRREKFFEKSAKSIEEEFEAVTDMAQSIVFEKCEKPLNEEQKEERVLEKTAHDIEENYKVMTEMSQSVHFDKCETPSKEASKVEKELKSDSKDDAKGVEYLKDDKFSSSEVTQDISKDAIDKIKETDKDNEAPSSIKVSDKIEVANAQLSGKSSPALSADLKDLTKGESGKSTPDLKESELKVDNQDSLLSGKSSPGLSGKSSPVLSGKLSPEAKAESKDSLLSEKSTPEHKKLDSKESSGKTSPDPKVGEKDKQETKDLLSAKSSPAVSGKSSPVPVDGTITDLKTQEEKIEEKIVKDDIKSEKSDYSKVDKETDKLSSIISGDTIKDEPHENIPKPKEPNEKGEGKDKSAATTDVPAEKKTEAAKDKIETVKSDADKKSLDVQETTEKKASVSDIQISLKVSEETSSEKISDVAKTVSPEDSKQLDDKTETKDVDSIDSGIGTEVDSKKKTEESEKITSSVKPAEIPVTSKEESIAGPSTTTHDTLLNPAQTSTEDLHLSGKSTPDIAEVEKLKEMQETLKYEKHIPGRSTPPTVPVSPIVKEISTTQAEDIKTTLTPIKSNVTNIKDSEMRSCTPGSDDCEIGTSTYSDISSGQVSKAPHLLEGERIESDEDDEVPGSPMSVTSQVAHSRSSSRYDFEDERIGTKLDPMNTSFYGALPDEAETDLDFEKALAQHRQTRGEDLVAEDSSSYLYEITKAKFSSGTPEPEITGQTQLDQINKNGGSNVMTASFIGDLPSSTTSVDNKKDTFESWGKPLGLPSPAPPNDNRGTPKKERKLPSNVTAKNKLNDDRKRSESPSKYKNKKYNPVYVDLTYVPHHGNGYYSYVDFFKRVRARYYVFSGIEPSREVYNALLEAKQTWEDKELEVTIIPTYDTDILGYWVAENEELLTKYKIDLSPSASRCTINLQDHETSCSAYRLEF